MTNFDYLSEIDFGGIDVAADWIRDIENSSSRSHKEKVIEKALMASVLGSASAQCFLYNCYLCYQPFFTYHVRHVPETTGLTQRDNPWVEFWGLLEGLRTRSITGNRARDRISDMSEKFDSDQWNMLARRVILKDLRCGISEKTLNKVLKNTTWAIPVFSCQLAQDSEIHADRLQGEKRLECKLDGVRVLAVVAGSGVTLYSRSGKELTNFPDIAETLSQMRRCFQHAPTSGGRFVLDGEIVGESFQSLMRQAHRKSNVQTTGMVYHVFDYIPLDDFERGYWNAQQHKRVDILERSSEAIKTKTDCVRIMPGIKVDLDTAEGHDVMRRFAADAVSRGYEGIMIKDLQAPYQCRRSHFWLKWKPTITLDLTVISLEEGTGKNQGRLGALVCEGTDNDRQVRVNVGGGFTDDDRQQFWQHQTDILGQIVEIEADAVTQNQDGTYSLRFPRFLRFRSFEPGNKI